VPAVRYGRRSPVKLLLCAVRIRGPPRSAALRRPAPAAADLYAEVEQVRGDSFRADWPITDLIRHAATCGAPDPGIVCRTTARSSPPCSTRCGQR
jgi:hypothetical protein